MTRIAIIGDSHFDESSRFEECIRVHEFIAADIERRGVDLLIHSGDVFERKSTPRERIAVADWLSHVAAFCPVVIVRGNHDALTDLPIFERLDTPNEITVEEAAGVHKVQARDGTWIKVAAVAWPRKAELLARLGDVSHEAAEQTAADALRAVLRGLGDEMAEGDQESPRILAMHAMVRGSMTSVGQPLLGCDMELGLEDLALARADLYALAHIHMPQEWDIAGAPCVYPGSPRRTAFGEVEEKGYVVAEFDGRQLVSWERAPTPCAPMLLIEDEWGTFRDGSDGWLVGLHCEPATDEGYRGAEVRFRYLVPGDKRDAARSAVPQYLDYWSERGVAHVKVEERVIAETRARSPEVTRAVTLEEKLAAFWGVKSFDPGARRERLIAKVHTVEEEIRNAS